MELGTGATALTIQTMLAVFTRSDLITAACHLTLIFRGLTASFTATLAQSPIHYLMKPPPHRNRLLCVLAWVILTVLAIHVEGTTPPGISLLKTIDLSPGADAYFPFRLGVNHSTHKLYVPGLVPADTQFYAPDGGGTGLGVKVVDTNTRQAIAGIDLGLYDGGSGSKVAFTPLGIAVDESTDLPGNRIYVLGQVGDDRLFLRTIDGATDTNETGEGTDLLLPVTSLAPYDCSVVVNPVNHKVYVSTDSGDIVVVDGPNRTVLTTLLGIAADGPHVMIANPNANKVFVFCFRSFTIVIDSSDDSYTSFSTTYSALDATYDAISGEIFVVGIDSSLDPELVAVDGTTGATITSTFALPDRSRAVAVDGLSARVFVGSPSETGIILVGSVTAYSATDLTVESSYPVGATKLAFDGTDAAARLYLIENDYDVEGPSLRNSLGIFDPNSEVLTKLTVGYNPGQIAINPKTNRIYIADLSAPEIVILDGTTDEILERLAIAPGENVPPNIFSKGFRPVRVSLAENRFYVNHTVETPATGSVTAYVDEYDGQTNQLIHSIEVNSDHSAIPPQIEIDDTRRRLYTTSRQIAAPPGTYLSSYDLVDDSLITRSGFLYSNDTALNPITGLICVAGGYLQPLSFFDPITQMTTGSVSIGMGQTDVAFNSRTNRAFAVSGNIVAVINAADAVNEKTLDGPADAVLSVAVDELTNFVFVGSAALSPTSKGIVTVFDGNNAYGLTGEIEVGRYANGMSFNSATRQLFASNYADGTVSVLQSDVPAPPDRLANISTRLGVETDENVLIGGFIVTGPGGSTKQILIRGIGPSLSSQNVSGALADPFLELHSGASTVATNDNWKIAENGSSQQAAIEATTIPPTSDLESAILITLAPGSYTAVLRGANSGTGVGLVEVYDLTASATTKMVNISTRGRVDTGDNVMIGGVIVTGADPAKVLLRAIGPSLSDAGVKGALQDPVLELHNEQGILITTNDDWQDDNTSEIIGTGIPPIDSRESAIVTTLYPSNYTAIVRGKNDTTGVGLVEAYFLP